MTRRTAELGIATSNPMGRSFMKADSYYGRTRIPQLDRNMAGCWSPAFSGQAMVEFALVLFVAMIVLFVAIQMAFIGQTALALGQLNYQAARYAAVNPTYGCDQVKTYMQSNGAPTVVSAGVNEMGSCGLAAGCSMPTTNAVGQGVRICMACTSASSGAAEDCSARTFGDSVQVSLAFDATSRIFLSKNTSNPNFFGIPFPTMLTSTETAMSE
jgi:hypothetical protein